jgi:hypothetical protein
MKCKSCREEPASCQGLCDDCQKLKALFKAMTPQQTDRLKQIAFQMADDLMDEKFGPEAGTVFN